MAKSETKTRFITAVVLSIFVIGWLFFAPPPVFLAISFILLLITLSEYRQIITSTDVPVRSVILYGSALMAYFSLFFISKGLYFEGQLAAVFAVSNPIAYGLLRTKDKKRQILILLTPILWFVLPLFCLYLLRTIPPMPVGPLLVLWMISVVASNDISAYFGGRRYGKTPLAKKISPNKTKEGSLFGLFGGVAVGYLTQPYLFPTALPWEVPLIALVIIPVSQLGDLFESGFKRKFGVKDSGKILPGHGGLLDRLDAVLFTLPVFGLIIYLLGIGHRW